MLLGNQSRRAIAATLLVILLSNLLAPSVSYALTSGPTQPEATSFEPIDTTDMVNMQTGDFTYNLPLLEIPGPEGGYPLSLSYHAGIQPNEEASWVGLGWTLNAGAINRTVNGYPDDWSGSSTNSHTYWAGGSSTTYNVGVSVGIANCASVGVGLAFSSDTYRGFGVGADISASVGYKIGKIGVSASLGVGVSPYGDGYVFGGAGLGVGNGLNASVGVGFNTNFEATSVGFNGGIGYSQHNRSGSLLGVSLSSGGSKPSLSLGGLSASVNNSQANNISTSNNGFHVDIPVWYGINVALGYSKQRYWTNESSQVSTYGSLNFNGYTDPSGTENIANDQYSLLEDPSYKNIVYNPNPKTVQGGSFFDYDVYNVNAQGLAGNMRPYIFQGGIRNQDIKQGANSLVKYYAPQQPNGIPFFRFENDFSNRYTQQCNPYSDPGNILVEAAPFDPNPITGFNDGNGNTDGGYGFGGGNRVAGSKHVDIGAAILPSNTKGYTQNERLTSFMIEGFSITNESGVTYHFALPAYSFNEEAYQEQISQSGGATGNRLTKSKPYAYTWYLTTITGPDFVDRNGNQTADDQDWGYWVNFEYGKWSNNYTWRTPAEGYQSDEDNLWQNCSIGTKEVYYLNAVRTRSHVALFEKDIRYDGKGVSPESFLKTTVAGIGSAGYANQGLFNVNSSQSLRLNKIYLLNSSDAGQVATNSGSSTAFRPTVSRNVPCSDCELAANTLDRTDIEATSRNALEAKAIRVVDFQYDYSLSSKTANSFDINNAAVKNGKLTLLSVTNRGKQGANLIPPVKFDYELSASEKTSQALVSMTSASFTTSNGNFKVGDLIMSSTNSYCGAIKTRTASGSNWVYGLVNSSYTGGATTMDIYTTKTPPYNKDFVDMWGMYKSDFNSSLNSQNVNLARYPSQVSSASVDAWSLRTINTPLGNSIKVGYESDTYKKSCLNTSSSLILTHIQAAPDRKTLTFNLSNSTSFALEDYIKNGARYKILLLQDYYWRDDAFNIIAYERYPVSTDLVGQLTISGYSFVNGDWLITGVLDQAIPNYAYNSVYYDYANYISTGNLTINLNTDSYGGGIRVANISTIDNVTSRVNGTDYSYNSDGRSSGVTSYIPVILDPYNSQPFNVDHNDYPAIDNSLKNYKAWLYSSVNSLYSIAREIPPPGVMYEYVTVKNSIKNPDEGEVRPMDGKTQYQFEVFRENMVGISDITQRTGPVANATYGTMFSRNLALRKFVGSIGNLKRTIKYDNHDIKISEVINNYLHDGLENLPLNDFMTQYKSRLGQQFYYQGLMQERIVERKKVDNQPQTADNGIKATLSDRESYPCIQTGQTVINYVNGTQSRSINLAFDFYSGAVTKMMETDAYGNNLMTETKPAYREYRGDFNTPGMDFKIINPKSANMLTQAAATYSWKVDAAYNKVGLISATANAWTDQQTVVDNTGNEYTQNSTTSGYGKVWRMKSIYDWLPGTLTVDGITPLASVSDFNWANPAASSANWKNSTTFSKYDVFSKALEVVDLNGNFSSTKMNFGDKRIVLTGSPANFFEIAYSGAEDAGVSQTNNMFVKAGDGTIAGGQFHTGTQSLLLGAVGKKGFLYTVPVSNLTAGRTYKASVWVKPATGSTSDVKIYYDINGTVKSSSASSGAIGSKTGANGWTLISLLINGSDITAGNTLNIYCKNDNASLLAYVDDFRFQPINSTTTAYVYDPFSGELSYLLDNNNIYTKFLYDGMGRLKGSYKEKIGVGELTTATYQYNYSSPQFGNDPINGSFTKQCTAGQIGSVSSVTVPQGMFTSYVSLADANDKAYQYAQDYANSNGTCTQLVAINCNNNMNVSGFTATFTNVSTGAPSTFSISSSGGVIGYLPAGTYNITVTKPGNTTLYTFGFGCGTSSYTTGNSGSFSSQSVILNSGCNTILISYPI